MRLLAKIRVAIERLVVVEHFLDSTRLEPDSDLADETGTIAGIPENGCIATVRELAGEGRCSESKTVGPLVETRQDGRAARGANRRRDEGIREAHAFGSESVHRGRLENRMPGGAHLIIALIVGEKKENVRTVRAGDPRER